MNHSLCLCLLSPNLSVTSEIVTDPGKSTLLLNTSKDAFLTLSSCKILSSSSLASSNLSLSELSTTKMTASVFSKQCCQRGLILVWPPTSHTVKLICLYSTVSTLNPMVGTVVTTSPSFSLFSTVVLPALSNPSIKILDGVL